MELASGLVVATPLTGRAAEHEGDIGRTDYDPERGELTITFRWGDTATFDLGPVEAPGAPIVYVDQNHWVMLARLQWAPHKLTAHREGYERLMGLARDRAITLPLSSAHAFETGRKDGRQRRELATTMLQLSRGWQMRNPLKVRVGKSWSAPLRDSGWMPRFGLARCSCCADFVLAEGATTHDLRLAESGPSWSTVAPSRSARNRFRRRDLDTAGTPP